MKKKAISIVCIVLAFLMMVTLVVSVVGSLGALAADEQDQIDALEQQKIELQSQQASIQTNINDLMAQQADVIEQKAAMDEKNELARQEIELINEQIDVYTDLIEQKARELEKAEAAEQAQYDLYCKRVRAMEEEGSYTYLDILFQCRSLSDVLSAIDMIGEIMDADKRLFEEYKTARENTEQVKAEYEGTLQQLGEKQETLEAEKAELEAQIAAAVEVINQLENDIEAAKAEYAKAAAAEAAAQASINAIIAQMQAEEEAARQEAAENNQQYTGTGSTATGTYIWPCPSSTYVTSAFGMREHPLFGHRRLGWLGGPGRRQRHRRSRDLQLLLRQLCHDLPLQRRLYALRPHEQPGRHRRAERHTGRCYRLRRLHRLGERAAPALRDKGERLHGGPAQLLLQLHPRPGRLSSG